MAADKESDHWRLRERRHRDWRLENRRILRLKLCNGRGLDNSLGTLGCILDKGGGLKTSDVLEQFIELKAFDELYYDKVMLG